MSSSGWIDSTLKLARWGHPAPPQLHGSPLERGGALAAPGCGCLRSADARCARGKLRRVANPSIHNPSFSFFVIVLVLSRLVATRKGFACSMPAPAGSCHSSEEFELGIR